jgi:hypothetical protein
LGRFEGHCDSVFSVDCEACCSTSAGDIGGVCVGCESSCKILKEATSLGKEEATLSSFVLASESKEVEVELNLSWISNKLIEGTIAHTRTDLLLHL